MQIIKKYFLILILSLLTPSVYADAPNQVVINYTGDIITRPCTISTKTMNFDFGNINLQKFQHAGDSSHWVTQTLDFTNCDTDTNIEIWFLFQTTISGGACNGILIPNNFQMDSYLMELTAAYNNKTYNLNCDYIGKQALILTPISREKASGTAAHIEFNARLQVTSYAQGILPQSLSNQILSGGGSIEIQYK